MSYLKETNLIYLLFNLLDANALFIIMTKNNLGKFDARSNEGIFVGYSMHNKAYRIYINRTKTIEESIHVIFYESNESKLSDSLVQNLNLSKHSDK